MKIHCLMVILLLVGAANSGRSDATLVNLKDIGIASWPLAKCGSGRNAQILTSGRRFKVNVDGFNRQREIEIAKDSRKLLSLAIAFKAEMDRNPGDGDSSAAVRKVRAIKKLARDVKRQMEMTLEPVPF